MGSISDMPAIKLGALRGKGFKGVSTDTIVETIWAITHFVYIGDNEVNFVRYSTKPSSDIGNAGEQQAPLSSVRSYRIHADATPSDIARSGSELSHDDSQAPILKLDTTAPSFMQLIRQTGLVVGQDAAASEWKDGSGKHQSHSMLFSVWINEGTIQAALLPNTTKHQEDLMHIKDTISRVCDLVAENWNLPLSHMNFLGSVNWNHITRTTPAPAEIDSHVLGDILALQSQVRPDKLAVEAWDGNLTYAELHDYSLRMAALLLQKGVELEERVGICMKKSKWSVVTFWAIIQAGCTGVSLDIRNPPKRMGALLEKVEARLVVADRWTMPALDGLDVGILRCDTEALKGTDISAPTLQWPQISPWTAAFITFTSGSTGLPKAVVAEHGPLYASTAAMADAIYLNETSRTFQFSSFVSDMSIGEIFSTMLKGGCVCVPSEEERLDNLPSALRRSRATHACLTSTVMSQVQPKDVPDLQYMVATGEGLSKENFLRWSPHVQMITAYGITESIIYDSYATPKHLSSDHRNIGMARGTCLWVTDPNDPEKLKPVGSVGEILIEGPVLARGYMGDPKKTAERFISAPSWLEKLRGKKENHRCYRSGDYGLRNADGTLIYLGREDTQIKLRGWRVELGEIEHSLLVADPMLGEFAVEAATFQSRGGQQALVAFVKQPSTDEDESLLLIMNEESRSIFKAAQSNLLEFLPRHMVPSMFIPIRAIPRNTVGKRDRRTLQSLVGSLTEEQLSAYQLRGSFTARPPETPDQELLQQLWAKTLRTARSSLGLDDNFFQVGGDSIKAIELVGELREHGRALAVSQIFQTPELGEMAGLLGYLNKMPSEEPPKALELIPESLSKEACVQEAAQACQLTVDLVEDIYPTTPMQEGLMAISAHRSGVYSHRVVFKIPESLDVERFKRAWEMLVAEQPIFRTRIVTLPSTGTVQVVTRYAIDWHSEMTLDEFVQYDDGTPFTYGSVLSRYAIVRDKNDVLHFAWSGHHAISDGWSRPAMYDEVQHIYHDGTATQQTPYAQFIRYISQLDAEESEEFWKEQFQDSVELFPRLPSSDYIPQALQMQTLSIDLNRQAASSITTATLVQAAWALITAAYANADEAVFGLTLSGRDAPVAGITKVMGITIATVAVKVVLDNTSTISEYLEDVQGYISQVKQYQHVGLQRISRLSPEARSAASFQNLLVIQPAGEEKDHGGLTDLGLQLVQREEKDTRDFALTVQCIIDAECGSLQIKAHYDNKVIDDEQAECLLHFFEHVMKQLATESSTRSLHDIDRVSPYDLSRLAIWNSQMPSAVEKTLHGLVEERAQEAPDAIALDGFDGQVTYAELDFLSSQLAGYLQQNAGVGPESRVVLSFAKSKLPIFAMLAILKSGGVCVSTNPDHPTTRLIELSQDAESSVLLCNEASLDRFRGHLPHVIPITGLLLEELKSAPIHRSPPAVLPSNAAFIVYTSGSTGKPKGSVLEHRSLATDLTALGQRIGLSAQSRTLQFSAYTFDAHILEIVGTLVHGGCVCVISDHERMNRLPQVINERGVNFALLTKTVSRLLDPSEVPTLQTLILSGEANGRQDYWRWAECLRLFNGMGPSECTPLVCLTRGPVSPHDDPANIGHAMACHLWVIDHRRPDRLVPIGCVGELTVEGPIVGRGYVNRPKQNAAAFMLDPEWSRGKTTPEQSGASRRFYRSGDLARMNANGSITFIGRADSQVKIAGQRVELGEIEDNLRRCSHASTTSAVEALPISSRGGATALAVFCARDSNSNSTEHNKPNPNAGDGGGDGDDEKPILPLDEETESEFQNAQAELSKVLPQYMVPAIFIPVKYLPFNASGKLERKKLRDWVAALDASELGRYYLTGSTTSRVPQTEKEKLLQALWARVLHLPVNTIGAEANFFRSGGDSVLSMKLIAEARSEGIAMTVADVFRMPVLKDMALTMVDLDNGQKENGTTAIEPFSLYRDKVPLQQCIQETAQDCGVAPDMIEDIYPCTPIQEALMAASSHRPEAYTYEVVLKLPETVHISHFKSSWEKLVSTHAIYRTRIVFRRDVGSLQVVLRSNITWHDITGMSTEQYVAHDGPLLVEYGSQLSRFAIVQHGGETVFVGRLHHALYDGWSMMRTYEEFNRIFRNEKEPRPLVPYSRFMKYFASIDEKESDSFWRSQFPSVAEGYPKLPSNYTPRPQQNKDAKIHFRRSLSSGTTAATVIQAAWAILMSTYSAGEDVVFGLTLSGRDAPIDGITDIVGPTLTSVPVSVHLDRNMMLAEVLDDMQNKIADIRRYQHVGLQHIRRLSPEASAAADFRNLLIVHNMQDEDITSPLRALGLQTVKSKAEETLDFPLTVECTILPDSLWVLINYDNKVVADQQVEFILRQLEHIISILIEESKTTKLHDIDLVSPYDIEHMNNWNSKLPEHTSETLHELVQAQARATPDAIAITGFDGEYTYRELDMTADRLAAHLTLLGVSLEKHVVLSFRKSTWPIIAMLAVLKSGGVCVSVNFEHPLSRRLDIVQDIEPVIVLCDADQEKQYSCHVPKVVVIDAALFATSLPKVPSDWVRPKVQPKNAAFIVYTSGSSTGKPKGCILEHHAVCLSQKINADTMNITRATRTLQFASYTWDPSILEIFGPLIRGGSVCVISDDERMNNLTATVNARKATWTFQTPTVAQLIDPKEVPTLETIVFCGEPLTQKVVQPWSAAGHARLINFYSAAETSNIGTIKFAPGDHLGLISIGRANGCGLWITKRGNPDRLVPVGCVGELLVEGHAVIRGYWRRPKENLTAFIKDPAWSRSQGGPQRHRRFYKTGDIGYFNHDGSVQLLGRADRQVKLNGMRVELHEIEYQIHQQLPAKSEVTVEIVHWGVATLTAFIKLPAFTIHHEDILSVEHEGQLEEFQTVIEDLQQSLPAMVPQYMVPSVFVPISFTPKLATTKTDRRRLTQFARGLSKNAIFGSGLSAVKEAPSNSMEASLQLVWSQVLKQQLGEIGVNDSFLSLGGDSITAMQAVSECRRHGIKLLVSTILEEKTIMAIAPHCILIPSSKSISTSVDAVEATDAPKGFPHLKLAIEELNDSLSPKDAELGLGVDGGLIEDIYSCTAMQEGILLSQQMDSELYQIQCVWEFADDPVFKDNLPSRLAQAWATMVQRHSSLRTGIVEHATEYGHFVQVVLKAHPTPRFTEAKVVIHDALEASDISEPEEDGLCAYLPRLTIFPTTKGRYACRLSVNHVLIDGTSTDIFIEEFISLLIGQTPASPAMDFSKYVEYEQMMKSDQSIAFWSDHLKDVQPCHVPTEIRHEVADTVQNFGFIRLPARATDGLTAFCRRLGITQAAFVQTAWAIVLGAFTRQDDVCFGYIASGRDAPLDGIEGCIGPFISMQVCRVRINGTVDEVLHRVHSDVIAGLEHRNSSLALIQSALDLKATPLFNTCVTLRRALEDAEQTKLDSLIKSVHGPEKTEFAISLSAYVGSTGTQISMSYPENKISREYASSISGSLETAIQSLLVSGSESVRTVEVIGAHERKLIEHQKRRADVQGLQADSDKKQPSNEMERDLQTVWVKVLNHPASRIGVLESFMSLGGDSIAAMQVAAQCRKVGIKLPVSVILQKRTIAAIAPHCQRAVAESTDCQSAKSADGTPFNLSPIQKRYLDQESATGWTKYNQNMLCRIKQGVSAQQLREAFDLIVNRHGMLRARFARDSDGGWWQSTLPPGEDLYRFISHSLKDIDEDITPRMEESADSLDIVNGPVFSIDTFDVPNQDGMVFLVSHHLVIDIVSWQTILREVEEFIVRGKLYSQPSLTFQHWCSIQEAEARNVLSAEQVLPLEIPPSQFEYWQTSDNTFKDLVEESFELPAFTTDLVLAKNNEALGTTPLEILLGPLLSTFHQAFPDRQVPSIFIEQHGREPCGDNGIEPSQVIGWFTTMYPIHVPVNSSTTALEAIRLVKDTRRSVSRNGRPYFAYRHLNMEGAQTFSQHDPVEILVNYTGIFRQLEARDSMIQLESRVKSNISNADPNTHRLAMIDIEMGVSRGIMTLHFGLNRRMANLDRVLQWIQNYRNVLSQTAIDLARQSPTHTLTDFPLLDLSYEQLASLLSKDLPQLGIKSLKDIEDIFPVTPFQRFSLEGHWATQPRHWDCLFFELPSGIDLARLRETCLRVVQQTPILRTLFIKHARGFLQIVLKSLEPQIDTYESKEDAILFMERLFTNDLAQLPPLGKPLLRFMIMRTPTQSRLLLRISHAQDDGFSRMVMVKALAAMYDGQRVPESISFSNYVRHAKQHHKEGIKYWRSVLVDAPPTSVLNVQTQPALKKSHAIRVEKTVPPFPTLDGVTSATIFNAACALLLCSLTKSSDVTFGRITSGRAGLDADFQDLMGPCVNIIPIRVQLQDGFRPSDALQLIHKQYAESIPYETMGLDDIIRECTNWSTSIAKFPVITQHVNQEKGYEVQSAGGGSFNGKIWESPDEDPFPWSLCLGAFPSQNGVRISIAANSAHTDQTTVERIMEGLCGFIGSVTQDLDE